MNNEWLTIRSDVKTRKRFPDAAGDHRCLADHRTRALP